MTNDLNRNKVRSARKNQKKLRAYFSSNMSGQFIGKADPMIRAVCFELDQDYKGKVITFDYDQTVAIAALVRLGVAPAQAAAVVDQGFVFAVKDGTAIDASRLSEGNFEPIDIVIMVDGTQHAIFCDDIPPVDFSQYDCWAMKAGKPIDIERHDPTKKLLTGVLQYHQMAITRGAGDGSVSR